MKNKLLTKLLLLPLFILMGSSALAQITVGGNVSDANGPVPGVNVIVKGTSNGAQSDFDGNYSLDNVATDAVLVFSYIGYTTQEVSVNGKSTVNVFLQEDVESLAEVVVIGYGTTTVRDATGSVTAVTSEDFNQGVITSPEQLIQGKTAGVQISQSSGEPGAGIDIRIRGANSVRSNNNPLFVVDGIPLSGGNTSAEGANIGVGTTASKNPLSFLNPNDIESISILKDASATAIYGSRGANGVVFITTKSGKGARGSSWDFSSNLSIASVPKKYDLLSGDEFLEQTELAGFNVSEKDFGSNTDWQDYIFRTSASTNNDLSYSNNYGSGNLRATFGYGKTFGVVENSDLERITGRLNMNHRLLNNKLKLGLQSSISRVNDETAPLGGSAGFRGDLIGAAYSANPTWPTNPDFDGTGGLLSPATALAYTQNISNTNRALVNFSAEYAIIPELSAKINLGYDTSESTRTAVASGRARNFDQGAFGNGIGAINDLNTESKLLEATLNYKKDFSNSSLDVLVGYSFQDFQRDGRNISGWGFFTEDMNEMGEDLENTANRIEDNITGDYQQYGYAGNISDGIFVNRLFPEPSTDFIVGLGNLGVKSLFVDTFDNTDEIQSYFGRINYSIADKYLFTGTVRADGSSRFGEDNQYGIFPSGAFAWKINNEDFVGDSVSTLKLRLGYGITGNQEGLGYGNFTQRQRYAGGDVISDGGEINIPGIVDVSFPNPELKWEETTQYGVGLDFGFNDDRFTGTVDVYRKETTDLLFNVLAAQPSVQPFLFLNLPDSKVVNEGIEFSLAYDIIDGEDISWNAGFNVAYNKNMVEELQGEFNAGTIRGQGLSLAFAQKLQAGQPLFSYFLREFEGFDPATGQPIQTDVQEFVDKSALPDLTGGFSTSFSYKNWTASTYFAGQFGHYIYNNTANAFFTAGAFRGGRNVPLDVLTTGESFDAAADVSTRFLESGDFIRMQNATVSYAWPLKEDAFFSNLVLSVTGQNLFVITDYTGLDPEVSSSPAGADLLNGLPVFGIDYASFPRPRTFTLGFNAKF
ncbi:SusC/RagA family TonB-linked outer membrane protein [Aureisphaera sp. CAU 1614]|uniref:SusC/RagA family TonB-linked outer membrane protein n=1 Tax=Halomarinibacterium sedimenti TaxID=2857106 RepID=A0A9X1JUH6_9FLAO|nr:SusC/RagA family TonB-linked outer membrane protein [Halomarinibacterium sedimenti]MBW2936859.1 SusC/RagA family TonB-linked outer membrane protein [Halomarinibacterium sedimenti]